MWAGQGHPGWVRGAAATVAGLALADAGVVALALPPILRDLDTSVTGVAAVLAVYALALAIAAPATARAARRDPGRVGMYGALAFAGASVVCGAANSLPLLLVARVVQAVGGGAGIAAAFVVVAGPGTGRRLWRATTLLGTATGPALGGLITELLGWRAIFLVQAPVVLLAGLAFLRMPQPARGVPAQPVEPTEREDPVPLRAAAALTLVSAALTAVLFLSVLLLVAGWGIAPLTAAAVVSVLPLAAAVGARVRGPARHRAAAGALLVAVGTGCLAVVPAADLWWIALPQAVAGLGMGLALPALAGDLITERTVGRATALLSVRHLGIAAGLMLLAPVLTSSLDNALHTSRERGAALVLDAPVNPLDKIDLARSLVGSLDDENPRNTVRDTVTDKRDDADDDERAAWSDLRDRLDDTYVAGVGSGLAAGFAVTAGLALIGGLLVVPWPPGTRLVATVAAGAVAAGGYAAVASTVRPDQVRLADPCGSRELPDTGGLSGAAQKAVLRGLDELACRFGSSREELLLAVTSLKEAREYEARYDVDLGPVVRLIRRLAD